MAKRRSGDGRQRVIRFTEPSFGHVWSLYEKDRLPHLAPGTRRSYRSIGRRLVAALPDFPTGGDLQTYLSDRHREGLCPKATRNVWNVTREVLRNARLHWPLLADFAADVRLPRDRELAQRAIPRCEERWPELLGAMPDARARALLSVLYRSGLRIQEALGVEPKHLDAAGMLVTVEQQREATESTACPLKTKASRRVVPLSAETLELLRAANRERMTGGWHPRGGTAARFVWPYHDRDLYRDPRRPQRPALVERLRAVAPDAFPRRSGAGGGNAFHAFRHSYGTAMLDAGLTPEELRPLLGHAHVGTTVTYCASLRIPVPNLDKARLAEERIRAAGAAARAQGRAFAAASGKASSGGCAQPPRCTTTTTNQRALSPVKQAPKGH